MTKIKNMFNCSGNTINELDPRQYVQGIQNSPAGCPVNRTQELCLLLLGAVTGPRGRINGLRRARPNALA
jgi:hypothetical protein